MRQTRILSSLLLALSLVTAAPNAFAWEKKVEHERPTVGSKNAPGYAQGKRPTVNGRSVSSEPIVATDKNGRPYDKRNGQKLSKENAEKAEKWAEGYEAKDQLTLISGEMEEKSAGINVGPFKDGRVELAKGKYGEVNLDVARVSASGDYSAGITKDGLQAQGKFEAKATLIGISGETETAQLGDPEGLNNASVKASGEAYIGADGSVDANLGITKNGINGGGTAEVFAGGKVKGTAEGTVTICGVQIDLQGEAEASYGIGAKASGQFSIDWSKMSVKIGGSASLTVGGGAGAGGTMEISLAKVLKDPGAAAECVARNLAKAAEFVIEKGGELVDAAADLAGKGIDKLSQGVNAVTSTLSDAGSSVASFFGFGGGDDKPKPTKPVAVATSGNNTSRNSNTTPGGTTGGAGNSRGATAAEGYGIKR